MKVLRRTSPQKVLVKNFRTTTSAAELRKQLLSPEITVSDDWIIYVKRTDSLPDEPNTIPFKLAEVVLPPNGLISSPSIVTEHSDLVFAIALALDSYLLRAAPSKTRTQLVSALYSTIVLCIEYLWRLDIVRIRDALPAHFARMPSTLASGGWTGLLQVQTRLQIVPKSRLRALVEMTYLPSDWGRRLIHTNCNAMLTGTRGKIVLRRAIGQEGSETTKRFARSTVRIWLTQINELSNIDDRWALPFIPFPRTSTIAKKVGRVSGRTENIKLESAVTLLKAAVEWVHSHGPKVAGLLKDLSNAQDFLTTKPRHAIRPAIAKVMAASDHHRDLETSLGISITRLDFPDLQHLNNYSVRELVLCVITACFIVIAGVNGRRKDEIIHKKFGLQRGCCRVVDAQLNLYEVRFYIEKTHQEWRPFYVNRLTYEAVQLMEELEEQFSRISRNPDTASNNGVSRPLFAYRRLSAIHGIGAARKWYDFSTREKDADARPFMKIMSIDTSSIPIRAHMFRRMYALIFYYRYENSDLQALMLQLGHFEMETTLTYLTDPLNIGYMRSIAATVGKPLAQAKAEYFSHERMMEVELSKVQDEKLAEEVYSILGGETRIGGYAKYVRRLHLKFSQSIKFSEMSLVEKSETILDTVKRRGHFVKPYKHGQCMAGNTRNAKIAGCYSKSDNKLLRERASQGVCSKCPFHLTSKAYLRNLEIELAHLKERAELRCKQGEMPLRIEDRELENLQIGVALMRERLAKEEGRST